MPKPVLPTCPPPGGAAAPTLAVLLGTLARQVAAGDGRGQRTTLQAIGSRRLRDAHTLTGALCIGGIDLAALLVAQGSRKPLSEPERHLAVVNAFRSLVEAEHAAGDAAETVVAERLIADLGLDEAAPALLQRLWNEIFIVAGPPGEVLQAADAALKQGQPALALRGFARLRRELGPRTPRLVHALGASCLHRLGRYADAEAWAQQGLGEQRAMLEIGPLHSEAELLQRWQGTDTPVVSILCTTYNHERYLESAIRGFLSQDCRYRFEILIHDDASTDATQAVVQRWQARYPTLIRSVLQTENQRSRGVRPFEILLAMCRGRFVATCEGDDFWVDAGKLERQVGFLEAHPEFSCSAHNYYHYHEPTLTVRPWVPNTVDQVLSAAQLRALTRLLWLPTLVFRRHFDRLPPERDLAAFGDQFLTSYLGHFGPCMYFESLRGAVRRENAFSAWMPLPELDKELRRIRVWIALARLHSRLGHGDAAQEMLDKITASPLDDERKAAVIDATLDQAVPEAATLPEPA